MAMNVESADECRICFQSGLYDIFNDELCLEEKSTKIKIYIVLNNFLFEKVSIFIRALLNLWCNH